MVFKKKCSKAENVVMSLNGKRTPRVLETLQDAHSTCKSEYI